jgi:Tol biopolymer transport system component
VTATTKRISVSSRGRQSNGQMTDWPSMSPGGRFVGFSSDASTLVRRDTHRDLHAYVRDLATGRTRLMSVSSRERPGNSYSYVEGISRGGRYVAIDSDASNLVPRDTNGFDMFVRDRRTGTTRRVSVSTTGEQADGNSGDGDMSPNGRYFVFDSDAANLVAGDTNDHQDVFLRDELAKTTTRVSVPHTGGQANGYSIAPAVSADGRYVVFVSNATNMVREDPTDDRDIFVRDLRTGQTELVTVGLEGRNASVDDSLNPAISGTGRFIAFHTDAALVPGDTNEAVDVYVRDTQSDITRRVSRSCSGTQGNAASTLPSLSATGRVTAFTSVASNLVAGDTNGEQDMFVHEWLVAP